MCKFTALSSGSFCQIYRVTDEALIAETAVWPNFFLMNAFFALKGSKLFTIIYYELVRQTEVTLDAVELKGEINLISRYHFFLNECNL